MIKTRNNNLEDRGTPLCDSGLPARRKAVKIVEGLTENKDINDLEEIDSPPVALWGVPASDFDFYDLFPDGTKFLGWFRCLENRTPDNEDLELYVDPEIPTVFFAQSFCHKNILAKHLAGKYDGLYVDLDGSLTGSVKAKVEAFLEYRI